MALPVYPTMTCSRALAVVAGRGQEIGKWDKGLGSFQKIISRRRPLGTLVNVVSRNHYPHSCTPFLSRVMVPQCGGIE